MIQDNYSSVNQFFDRVNYLRKQAISNRNFLVIVAVIVGVLAGLAAALLKSLTHHIALFLQNDLQWKYKYFLYLFFPLIGIFLSVFYVKRFIRKSKFESGLTPILYAISRKSSNIKFHNIYSQIITSALTVGFGGSSGLEAPIVYSGSAIGSNLSRFFGLNYRETTMLLACGAAAGIAGAFNSPVAGIVFAVEVLLPEFSIPAFIPLLMAAATASVVSRIFYSEPLFYLVTEGWKMEAILFYVVLGGIIGIFSIYFSKLNYWIKGKFKKVENPYHKVVYGGLVLGLLIFIFPALYGEGYITIQQLLAGNYSSVLSNSIFADYKQLPFLVLLFSLLTVFGKSLATLITLGSGGNGGTFGPSLVMGGLIGFIFAHSINQTELIHLNTPNFIVAGMAAALSGIMYAPLTGIFLIAEITGGYVLMVPLMIVSAISYFINRATNRYSIYTNSLAEKGELLSHEDKDSTILQMMKLKYLIKKDFLTLNINETPADRRLEIVHSKRNIFPVIDDNGMLKGIVDSDRLIEVLLNLKEDLPKIESLLREPKGVISITDSMIEVLKKMKGDDIGILPVTDLDGKYIGFVSKSTIFNKYRALLLRQASYLQ